MKTLILFQKGWSFNQDGPGHRLVYHLQGCNLVCPWCANPEGLDPVGTLLVRADKLTPEVCPHGAVTDRLDRTVCARCAGRECLGVHRNEGLRWSAFERSVPSLVSEAQEARSLFHGGGGVTFSGGEPTLQFDGLREALEALAAAGIHSAVETNGTHPRLPELFSRIGTLIVDLKHIEDAAARETVGAAMTPVLENIRRAADEHPAVRIRITLVPGFNGGEREVGQIASFLAGLPQKNLTVEALACHEYGRAKWTACGRRMPSGRSGATVSVDAAEAIFRSRGLRTERT